MSWKKKALSDPPRCFPSFAVLELHRVAQVGSTARTGSLSRRFSGGPDALPSSLEYLVNTSTFHTGVGAVLFPDVQLGDEIVLVTRGGGGI